MHSIAWFCLSNVNTSYPELLFFLCHKATVSITAPHSSIAGADGDFFKFLCDVIYARTVDGTALDAVWKEAPSFRPITKRTAMLINGVKFTSPPECLLTWHNEEMKKMVREAADQSGATVAAVQVCWHIVIVSHETLS